MNTEELMGRLTLREKADLLTGKDGRPPRT